MLYLVVLYNGKTNDYLLIKYNKFSKMVNLMLKKTGLANAESIFNVTCCFFGISTGF